MKEIKAFVRTNRVEAVIKAVEATGAPGITISTVQGVGYGYEPMTFTFSTEELKRAPKVVKVEIVCRSRDVEAILKALTGAAWTGIAGDGIAFVTPVEHAIKIRTGEVDSEALKRSRETT